MDEALSVFSARIRELEDREAIKEVFARYCAFIDDDYDLESLAELLTPDFKSSTNLGDTETSRAEFLERQTKMAELIRWGFHLPAPLRVAIDGDRAIGEWAVIGLNAMQIGDAGAPQVAPVIFSGRYSCSFRRVGNWQIEEIKTAFTQVSRVQQGWVDERFVGIG